MSGRDSSQTTIGSLDLLVRPRHHDIAGPNPRHLEDCCRHWAVTCITGRKEKRSRVVVDEKPLTMRFGDNWTGPAVSMGVRNLVR